MPRDSSWFPRPASFGVDCTLRNGGQSLSCPCCGSEYLHQGRIEVYGRDAEDAPSFRRVVSGDGAVEADEGGNNPSSRRQGLIIFFECEDCHLAMLDEPGFNADRNVRAAFRLAIYQHKGNTFVEW